MVTNTSSMEIEDVSYKAFMKMLESPITREGWFSSHSCFGNWFVVNPEDGSMWLVPIDKLSEVAFTSGCIIPHKTGWWPIFNSMKAYGYEGCTSASGVMTSSPQVMKKGVKVGRGPSWQWGNQGDSGVGVVTEVPEWGKWVRVDWPDGTFNKYRWAHSGRGTRSPGTGVYDLVVLTAMPADLSQLEPYKRINLV